MICILFIQLYAAMPPVGLCAEGRPNEHFCPITLRVMVDPVVAADGQSYEREAISRWFATSQRSPVINTALDHTNLTRNISLKKMIDDWIPGRSHKPSVLDSKPAADIARCITEEFKRNKRLLDSAKGQHIVAFLGNTGSGKSTLVNLLAGKGLVVGHFGDDYILADPADTGAMAIGPTGNSETLYPNFIDVNGLRFFDLPGFNDTDGSERNLVNAAFIRQILLAAASVRLVFVAGQDQFTADKSASVKRMFNSIKQLFVVDGQGDTFVDDGIFIATKVLCIDGTNIPNYLVQKTDARDKEELNAQLQSWNSANRLCYIFHPVRGNNNAAAGAQILKLIQEAHPAKIVGVNVSALYPLETVRPLESMFSNMMEEALARKLGTSLTTVSDYDIEITSWASEDFWKRFDMNLCKGDQAVSLLKEFCINPYNKALASFERENERKRQGYIQELKTRKEQRVKELKNICTDRAEKIMSTFRIQNEQNNRLMLLDGDFLKSIYDSICKEDDIEAITTDEEEKEIMRSCYLSYIRHFNQQRMVIWHQQMMASLQEKNSGQEVAKFPVTTDALTGKIYEMEENDAQALTCYRRAAEQNDAWAQYQLGMMYEEGRGVRKNEIEAERWYNKAIVGYKKIAGQGNADAQYQLGVIYEDGEIVPQDREQAVEWYQKAANQGHVEAQYVFGMNLPNSEVKASWLQKAANQGYADAQFKLGQMYAEGIGIPKNSVKAVEWFKKSADQGHVEAQYALGVIYENGDGAPQDEVKAIEWFQKAADQGNADAQFRLGRVYEKGTTVIQKDDAKAIALYQNAADQEHEEAQYALGVRYEKGNGVPADQEKAAEWFERAANQGHPEALSKLFERHQTAAVQGDADAQYVLGMIYEEGKGVPKDVSKACRFYKQAAEQGHAEAQYHLGRMYENGSGIPKDIAQAFELYKEAAEHGNREAQAMLGTKYCEGDGTPKNEAEEVRWLQRAADQGHARSQDLLGVKYAHGRGVSKDAAKATEWFQKAADQENANAQCNLAISRGTEEEVNLYKKASRLGYARGQYLLGTQYENGNGVPKDMETAFVWYKKAANQGHKETIECLKKKADTVIDARSQGGSSITDIKSIIEAQYMLGMVYTHVNSFSRVPENSAKAVEYFTKAANHGHAKAQYQLGTLYKHGRVTPKNETKAFELYQQAANQGHLDAEGALAQLYETGQGVRKDTAKAAELYQKIADQGHAKAQTKIVELYQKEADAGNVEAQFRLGVIYEEGRGVLEDKSKAVKFYRQAAEQGHVAAQATQSKIVGWYKKEANQGNADAQYKLVEMFFVGGLDGVFQDDSEAIESLERAAEWGHAEAQFKLGLTYENGFSGVPKNIGKAVGLYEQAANQGHADAQFKLGQMYAEGIEIPKNIGKAVEWFKKAAVAISVQTSRLECYQKAAELGDSEAQCMLCFLYVNGFGGVEKDDQKAVAGYQKAADQGYPIAQYILGIRYAEERGFPKDEDKSREWYQKAAQQGVTYAQYKQWLKKASVLFR